MKNKRQHYVPTSYLKAWCDPTCPENQTPYVWVFSKDGAEVRKKSPEKLFNETDFYTIRAEGGERDLSIESSLSRLEGEFAKLRKNKLDKGVQLSERDAFVLCMFVAAMYGRTKRYKVHWSQQWQRVVDLGEHMQRVMDSVSPEERMQIATALTADEANGEESMTIEDARMMVEQPIQNSLSTIVETVTPLLVNMPFFIIEAPENSYFITSDAPCVWYEPNGIVGLSSPDIEISLPLSPKQTIFFGKRLNGRGIYLPLRDNMVDDLNRRTRIFAHEHCVSNSNTLRIEWFKSS